MNNNCSLKKNPSWLSFACMYILHHCYSSGSGLNCKSIGTRFCPIPRLGNFFILYHNCMSSHFCFGFRVYWTLACAILTGGNPDQPASQSGYLAKNWVSQPLPKCMLRWSSSSQPHLGHSNEVTLTQIQKLLDQLVKARYVRMEKIKQGPVTVYQVHYKVQKGHIAT